MQLKLLLFSINSLTIELRNDTSYPFRENAAGHETNVRRYHQCARRSLAPYEIVLLDSYYGAGRKIGPFDFCGRFFRALGKRLNPRDLGSRESRFESGVPDQCVLTAERSGKGASGL